MRVCLCLSVCVYMCMCVSVREFVKMECQCGFAQDFLRSSQRLNLLQRAIQQERKQEAVLDNMDSEASGDNLIIITWKLDTCIKYAKHARG